MKRRSVLDAFVLLLLLIGFSTFSSAFLMDSEQNYEKSEIRCEETEEEKCQQQNVDIDDTG